MEGGRLRILHLFESWRPVVSGYTSRSWAILESQASRTDLEPWAVVSSRQATYGVATLEAPPGLKDRIRLLTPSTREVRLRRLRPFYLDAEALAEALARECARVVPDVLHCHWSSGIGAAAAGAARRSGIPLVAEVRFDLAGAVSTETLRFRVRALERALRRRFERHLGAARAVVAASYSLGDLLRRTIPEIEPRLHVVPNAVDPLHFRPRARERRLQETLGLGPGPIVGSTAKMLRFEGLERLVEIAPRLREERGDIGILFVGGGPRLPALLRRALDDRGIRFAGLVPFQQMPEHYALFDVFVVPRRDSSITRYASPIKILEAMACGLAVVASDVGDIGRLLEDGRGVLVSPESNDELVRAILELVRDPGAREEMGARAREWVVRSGTWATAAARYASIYEDLGPGPGRSQGPRSSRI